jgi:hypothetical protein
LLAKVEDDPHILNMTSFSNEAWFHPTDYMNSQNTCKWSKENPLAAHETPIHPVKIGMWYRVSQHWIVGPIFSKNTINLEHYIDIVHELLRLLTKEEIAEAWFQQDSTSCHTAWAITHELSLLFRDQIISKGLWPHNHQICHHQPFSMGLH